MTIPILVDGKKCGEVTSRREGAYTLFEARCAVLPGLHRLYAFGEEGGSVYLGVLQPEGGELRLRRRFSRAAMRAWPQSLGYAALSEKPLREGHAAAPEKSAPRDAEREEKRPREEAAQAGDGALFVTEDGARCLALPCALRRAVPGTRVREIDERRYLLFRC